MVLSCEDDIVDVYPLRHHAAALPPSLRIESQPRSCAIDTAVTTPIPRNTY
jgi:hypothetical protein